MLNFHAEIVVSFTCGKTGSEKIYRREIFTPAVCMNEKIVCLYHTACDALVQYTNLAEFQRGVGQAYLCYFVIKFNRTIFNDFTKCQVLVCDVYVSFRWNETLRVSCIYKQSICTATEFDKKP